MMRISRLWQRFFEWVRTRLSATRTRPQLTRHDEAAPTPAGPDVTVVIPALNEERHIADVVRFALADPVTAEVIVIDDSSIDGTAALAAEAGARVLTSTMLGKGASMKDGALAARHEHIVYLDGDLSGLRPGIIGELAAPLRAGRADFVKARFGRGGGRVTELTAKPMLRVFFPELAGFGQPLGGIIAARRALLQALRFEDDYGVDVGLLIDALRAGARLDEVEIGELQHDSQPLHDLTVMANEVSRAIYTRAREAGRLHVEQIMAMYEGQRQATASFDYILSRRKARRRLLLLDMDGTVTTERYVEALARVTGASEGLSRLLDAPHDDAATRSADIAALFRFVHREQFERVARALPIRPGVVEAVNRLRRAGFMVGIVSDSYFVAAEIVRRRIFADFAIAHTLAFQAEVCTGALQCHPAFLPPRHRGERDPAGTLSKGHVVARFREPAGGEGEAGVAPFEAIWAVGDNLNDIDMLKAADQAFVIEAKSPDLARRAGATEIDGFDALAERVPLPAEAA